MKQVLNDSFRQDSMLRPEDLIDLDRTLYAPKEDELVGRDVLPIKQDVPDWVESHEFKKYETTGEASTVYHVGDDLPNVMVDDNKHSITIFEIALSYNISKKEIRAAQATGVPLEDTMVRTLRRKFSEKENTLIFEGEESVNASGLCDYGTEVSMGDWQTGTDDTDAKQIYNDMDKIAIEMESQTGNWRARTAVFSKAAAKKAKQKKYDSNQGGPGRSAWDAIVSADIFDNIYISDYLTTGGSAGNEMEVMVLDNTPENMALVLPQDMQRLDPRDEGLYYEVPVWERLGEVLVRYDSSYSEDSYDSIMYGNPTLS